jgi:hypothetical protein
MTQGERINATGGTACVFKTIQKIKDTESRNEDRQNYEQKTFPLHGVTERKSSRTAAGARPRNEMDSVKPQATQLERLRLLRAAIWFGIIW